MALLATTVPGAATAAPSPDTPDAGPLAAPQHEDDRPDMLEEKRRETRAAAFEQVVNGEATVQDRNGSKSVQVAPGQWAQYELQDSDEVLSFLVEFGESKDERFPTAPAGPLHNEIPEPDRETDNSTYWVEDFDRDHYMDMFFNGTGETFKGVYEEMSSGRYTLNGDVSEWVKVENNEASYGETESNTDMTRFIDDTAEAWLQAQQDKGMTDAEIGEYLQRFDQWDRYDHDGDGDFAEPDGYIDHFQAIHAGEGEEAGAPTWAIWSHRWAANIAGTYKVGPEGAPFGGIEIGDTGLWIRDYTTEPENGGLGVFAHEYAHDLGLPDLYDTSGGENSTGFWTLMSSGSWLSRGDGAIGTTPNQMGAWEKLQLGWLDYNAVRPGEPQEYQVGPAAHATKKDQALIAILPQGSKSTNVGPAAEGQNYFYSGRGDDRDANVTSPEFVVPDGADLTAQVQYAIEDDWDYAYAEIKPAGGEWTQLETDHSTSTNPNGSNLGHGITGDTDEIWVPLTADLAGYAGQTVQIRFRMVNDAALNELGFLVDDIAVGDALVEGVEDGAPEWTLDEFQVAENGVVSQTFNHYYIAENRQYLGYDEVLRTGPYNFGFPEKPNWVEHFPYQDGLLIWYWNTSESDNNVATHPGSGQALPVDARGAALTWSDGSMVRNRIQSFDSTFGIQPTDAITLHKGDATLKLPRRQAVSVFDDRFAERYYDEANPMGSVLVPNTGTRIEVLNENRNGMMQLRVSK